MYAIEEWFMEGHAAWLFGIIFIPGVLLAAYAIFRMVGQSILLLALVAVALGWLAAGPIGGVIGALIVIAVLVGRVIPRQSIGSPEK